MIDLAINEVYKRDQKVFIPDFGAVFYSEASDSIDFNELLTFDDGKLIAEIQKQEYLSEEDARRALEEYLVSVKSTLDQGKSYFLGGIGYLSKNDEGALVMQKTKGTGEVITEPEADNSSEIEEEIPEEANDTDQASEEDDPNELEAPYVFETGKKPFEEEQAEEVTATSTEEQNDDPFESDEESYPFGAEIEEELKEDSSGNWQKALWVIIPLALIALVAAYYFVNGDFGFEKSADQNIADSRIEKTDIKTDNGSDPDAKNEEEPLIKDKDEANMEGSGDSEKEKEIAPVLTKPENLENDAQRTSPTISATGKMYSLVMGSFKVESNADNYARSLNERGMDVDKFEGFNDFYFVGIEQIDGKEKALEQLGEARSLEPTAWIIRKQ